jgi:hypothetical protein
MKLAEEYRQIFDSIVIENDLKAQIEDSQQVLELGGEVVNVRRDVDNLIDLFKKLSDEANKNLNASVSFEVPESAIIDNNGYISISTGNDAYTEFWNWLASEGFMVNLLKKTDRIWAHDFISYALVISW